MADMINFGIDLGTTNSLIAKFENGQVEVFKNPSGFRETLPSVVGFRNDRILVGDSAANFARTKNPKNVASRFKRKMGTTESIKLANSSKTPIELSSFVLKELKHFVHTGEDVKSVVITIPASFDTIQSNATKEAGILAGFKNILLLQEPIAASLAFANKDKESDLRNSQWIVYDLGGGTFDVALVKIIEGELNIVDHEGDNYLGGTDFDSLIVEEFIVPELNKLGKFEDILLQMKSEKGRYKTLWPKLLDKAETAKIELTTKTSADIDIDFDLHDDNNNIVDTTIVITRSEFENIIKGCIDSTAEMIKKILTRNSLQPEDLKYVLMVGGSTFIPFVRSRIEELLGVHVNTSIDPTNAIVVGAAYYAGTKESTASHQIVDTDTKNYKIRVKAIYNRNTQEEEELFSAKIEGDIANLYYKIVSADGSFDSGLKVLTQRISEDLPLRAGTFNIFKFFIYDSANNIIETGFKTIQIAQGKYSINGQMLPEDISLVVDDISKNDTKLLNIFSKNTVLPAKTLNTVEVAKTIIKGSSEEAINIIVVEGPSDRHALTNKPIGRLVITGNQLTRDLIKGTEVDLTFEMSESRDFTISAYLNGTGQEFSQVFKGTFREVIPNNLLTEAKQLEGQISKEIDDAKEHKNFETTEGLIQILPRLQLLIAECSALADDDTTDDRFKLEDKKRKIAQEIYDITSSKRLDAARHEYANLKNEVSELVSEHGNDKERYYLRELVASEPSFITTNRYDKFESQISKLRGLRWSILNRMPSFLNDMFEYLVSKRTAMNDQLQATQLIEIGRKHIHEEDWDQLSKVIGRLWDLMPDTSESKEDIKFITGIVK